ncbi:MAG: tyrosine-protein phosphatase [Dysgonamonadaceae bacterium]|jgi:protein-tyrosine phosphatase|nr:tyrosine-protein phosphatase [Dysgonamonadaceae bacterium]
MTDKLLPGLILGCFVLFSSCAEKADYDIDIVCETTNSGDYVIKWEIFPSIDGKVKIYRSNDPNNFSDKEVELELPIQEGVATMEKGDFARSYFKLVFGKNLCAITSNRVIKTENILNFREEGGFRNQNEQQIKWGKLYRSGLISNASKSDIALLKALHIKSVVDLRTDKEVKAAPSSFSMEQTYRLPLEGIEPLTLVRKVIGGQMKKGDALVFQEDLHVSLVKNNTDNFKRYFEILADSSNYPLIVCCTLGKVRTGVVMALTLAALDIDVEQIHQDYMQSIEYIDFKGIVKNADRFSPEVQEALTVLLAPQKEIIEYTRRYIEKEYGSLDEYFENELQLTTAKREKLKELLLYPPKN